MAPAPHPRPTAPAADEARAAAAPRRGFIAAGWAKFSDNVIPSLVVTVIVGLVIFSFDETSDRITRLDDDIDARFTAVDARFTKLDDDIDARFTAVDARFTKLDDDIDARFTAVDARFTKLDDDIDARFTKLEDDIDARFTKLEDDIDARFTKLEENQHDIALTLARLVALFEARDEAEATRSG